MASYRNDLSCSSIQYLSYIFLNPKFICTKFKYNELLLSEIANLRPRGFVYILTEKDSNEFFSVDKEMRQSVALDGRHNLRHAQRKKLWNFEMLFRKYL